MRGDKIEEEGDGELALAWLSLFDDICMQLPHQQDGSVENFFFERLDLNKNGFVELSEFRHALKDVVHYSNEAEALAASVPRSCRRRNLGRYKADHR